MAFRDNLKVFRGEFKREQASEHKKDKNKSGFLNKLKDFIHDIGEKIKEAIACGKPTADGSSGLSPVYYIELQSGRTKILEKEEEEEDVYQIYRKDAFEAQNLAIQYAEAAKDAHSNGDRKAAKKYSRKAKEERATAKKLHSEAAREILNVKNCKNDLWTLDLHGLHKAEAVDALRERLQTIELLVSSNSLATSVQATNHVTMDNSGIRRSSTRLKKHRLRVITGRGNHSKGAPKLRPAVQKFLTKNGYGFNDAGPGSFMVQPKFCEQ